LTGLSWERTCLISSSLLSVGSGLVSCLEGPAASQEGRGESSSLLSSMIMVAFLSAATSKSPGRLMRGISSSLLDIISKTFKIDLGSDQGCFFCYLSVKHVWR